MMKNPLGKLHQSSSTRPGQKFPSDQFGIITVDMGYFLGPNWNLLHHMIDFATKSFSRPPLNLVEIFLASPLNHVDFPFRGVYSNYP